MMSEVKKALKEMKDSKALGIDKLTSDVMILGGDRISETNNKTFYSDLWDKKDTS